MFLKLLPSFLGDWELLTLFSDLKSISLFRSIIRFAYASLFAKSAIILSFSLKNSSNYPSIYKYLSFNKYLSLLFFKRGALDIHGFYSEHEFFPLFKHQRLSFSFSSQFLLTYAELPFLLLPSLLEYFVFLVKRFSLAPELAQVLLLKLNLSLVIPLNPSHLLH